MVGKRVINVGIDLGTSRSVISCDNGVRTYLASIVGYPKDAVSRKLLGKDIVFGDEALKHRMSLEMHRPFDKGMLKISQDLDENSHEYRKAIEAARALLKRLIEFAVEADPAGAANVLVRGVLGTPALASRKNKKAMLEIARGILDDVMYVSEPFAVAYGLGLLTNAFIVDIGAGTVDLCRMHGTMPTDEDQITTMKAGDYVDQIFYELLSKKYTEANFTLNMVKKFKEENSSISDRGDSIFIELPVKGKPIKHDVTAELRMACKAIVPDIVEGIRKLIASYDPEFQMHLKDNVILAGGGSQIVGLKKEIEDFMIEKLGYGRVTRVEEPLYAGANGALMLCKDMPDEYWHELKTGQSKVKN
ncbi:MamK family actin-like protein [Candidatus Magnetominusculus xianensis]|uniref:Magnetosome protein MamK n=1 Tax=Candidatus Magnetominusculus xianensis TaxID=1748249 RepID=A0ABR5SJP8_9BACT|nr:MamK family actin-like protein [Candidatus Magnetominusculus xianensis]KWT94826.1 magnetosome protein MamK [Candidatus Magnetominusculus xianensis]MBF0404718.1 rod shape-determining protein [Nitrospirota bacterium]